MMNNKSVQVCPFLDENCVKGKCAIYNTLLDRCEIGVMAYNLYKLSLGINKQLENIEK